MDICHLSIEVTRKCNLRCRHCCRGNPQNKNISYKYIDSLLDQVDSIHQITFTGGEPSLNIQAIQYFIDECKNKNVHVEWVTIITNGIRIEQDFVDVCLDMYFKMKWEVDIVLSDDKYHTEQRQFDDSLLSSLPFYRKMSDINESKVVLREGRGELLDESTYYGARATRFTSIENFNDHRYYILLNVDGEIINGIDWSYDKQKKHCLCRVENLLKFYNYLNMTDNKFVEEDWERLSETEKMYIWEKENEVWEEYQEWIEKQEKLPAKIIVKMPEELNQEEYDRERQEVDRNG